MTDLVLLHGVGLDRRMWRRCQPALTARHRVHTPDLPGHGIGPAVGERTSVAELADRVAESMPPRAHVVGFSLGALVAQQLALSCPDRIASLVLVSSVANRSPAQADAVRDRLRNAERGFADAARAAVDRWMSPAWRLREPELAAELEDTLLANDRGAYLACYRVFATADAELWPHLPDITTPTLCVTGGADPGSTPDMTRALAAAIPHARAEIIDGARHLLPLEYPAELSALILSCTEEVDRAHTV